MLGEHAVSDRVLELDPVSDVGEVAAAQDACHRVHASDAAPALRRRRYSTRRAPTRAPSWAEARAPGSCC